MKDGLNYIVGKTIESVVVGKNGRSPHVQVFLVFSDGTSFEFWGESFNCAGGLDKGGIAEAASYIEGMGGKVTATYPAERPQG